MIRGLFAFWGFIKWLNALRKHIGTDTEAYFTKERALRWRFRIEVWARRIADGELDGLPAPIRWLFSLTFADEALAKFFQHLFKSDKLATGDKSLDPTYPPH